MLRTASSLPHTGLLTLGSDPARFQADAASLLPGLLAATRTGLPPAGDDELTNTKKHHGITSRCHLLFCWAHEKTSMSPNLSAEFGHCMRDLGRTDDAVQHAGNALVRQPHLAL